MHIECPNCRKSHEVENPAAGREVQCPECQALFIVPAATAPEVQAAAVEVLAEDLSSPTHQHGSMFQQTVIINQASEKTFGIGCAAWILLLMAVLIHIFTLFLVAFPLYLAAFIVAIVAIAKGRTVSGVLVLLASIIAPILITLITLALIGAGVAVLSQQAEQQVTSDAQPGPAAVADEMMEERPADQAATTP